MSFRQRELHVHNIEDTIHQGYGQIPRSSAIILRRDKNLETVIQQHKLEYFKKDLCQNWTVFVSFRIFYCHTIYKKKNVFTNSLSWSPQEYCRNIIILP